MRKYKIYNFSSWNYVHMLYTMYTYKRDSLYLYTKQKWFKSTITTGFAAENDGKKLVKVFILREYVTHTYTHTYAKHTALKAIHSMLHLKYI